MCSDWFSAVNVLLLLAADGSQVNLGGRLGGRLVLGSGTERVIMSSC
jgi:hypothetical protein